MNKLELYRSNIDKIDKEMASLFEARMNICREVADYKRNSALSIEDASREADLIRKNSSLIEDPEIKAYYVDFLKETVALSQAYQKRLNGGMRVGYSGVEGAFAHIAAKRMFPDVELVSCPGFTEAYRAVERGEIDSVVLPLENSYAGEVGTVMDLMFSGSLYVNQVLDIDIIQNLIANKGATKDGIKTVVSHPQALQQCDEYIKERGYETQASSNTALAAKSVKESGSLTTAAIASAETASLFGLEVLEGGINASKNNTTRFGAFSRSQNRPAPAKKREDENFILVFTVRNEAGALAQTLNIIGAHGYNMRSLRSRPMKGLLWNYFFYIEAEGNINDENGSDMLQELSAVCAKLKLVGTYYANNVN